MRVWLALGVCGAIVVVASAATALWATLAFVPIVNIIAVPSLIGSVLMLVHVLPFVAYLLLAQTDAPKHSGKLFLPFSPARHLGLLVAVVHYAYFVLSTAPSFVIAVVRTAVRVWYMPEPDADKHDARKPLWAWWERFACFGIKYQSPRHRAHKLDVYLAQPVDATRAASRSFLDVPRLSTVSLSPVSSVGTLPDVDPGSREELGDFPTSVWSEHIPGSPMEGEVPVKNDLAPVVVFLYDVGMMGPIRPARWMFGLTGAKFAQQGYVTVVPDITCYPDGHVENMVADVRHVLGWVKKEIRNYGGDPTNIYLCGHGLGAHLGMYTLSQDAIVHSRDRIEIHNAASQWTHLPVADPGAPREIPNGLRTLRIYAPEVDIPHVKGMILLSPVADVIKQVRHEARCWLEHVSPLRRALGSSQTKCMRHSLGHILFAARDLVELDWLPQKVLIIHGGEDQLVPVWQAVWLADLLNGLEIPTTMKQYSRLAHFDVSTALMSGLESQATDWLLHDICTFVDSP